MFHIFKKAAQTRLVTIGYPQVSAQIPEYFRGAPSFEFSGWRDARPAAEACPTGAIAIEESGGLRRVTVDYGLCIYCGECADADCSGAVKITRDFELAVRERGDLVTTAEYPIAPDGSQGRFRRRTSSPWLPSGAIGYSAVVTRSPRSRTQVQSHG